MNTKNLPHFKYNPNVYKNGMVEFGSGICQCCGEKTNAYIQNIYAIEDIDCICMNCVSSGKAAHKFNGTYIQDADWIDNPIATEELYKKTPGYISWQGENWAACCNDYCEYIETVGTKELEELGIAEQLFDEDGSFDGYDNARQYLGCVLKLKIVQYLIF